MRVLHLIEATCSFLRGSFINKSFVHLANEVFECPHFPGVVELLDFLVEPILGDIL
jgi:hypothetical protein